MTDFQPRLVGAMALPRPPVSRRSRGEASLMLSVVMGNHVQEVVFITSGCRGGAGGMGFGEDDAAQAGEAVPEEPPSLQGLLEG
ncbi:MAG: hypothetical protein Q7R39_06845 [Dehalococcoidia bacterium]|nr:hypothetical protein [Dehalococcoidia bacterium]